MTTKIPQDMLDELEDNASGSLWNSISGFISYIRSSVGSSIIGFLQSGSNAVPRNVADKLKDVVHAKDFGVVANGTTDDSIALQRAATYIALNGGRLILPPGQILLNTTVIFSGGGITIEGSNYQSTWIVNGTTNSPAIQFGNGTTSNNRNAISNVIFGQKGDVVSVSGNCGFKAIKQNNLILQQVHVFKYPGALYDGLVFENCTAMHFDNNGIEDCKSSGMKLTKCLDTYATKCRSDSNNYGVTFVDCPGVYFSGFACFGNKIHAWNLITDGIANDNVYHFYTNCIGDTSGSHNWNITQLSIGKFTACWAATQLDVAINTTACGFWLSGAKVSDIDFTSCAIIFNNGDGISLDYCQNVNILGGTIGTDYKPDGQGNGRAGVGSGVKIGANANRIRINGGCYQDNSDYGIDIVSGADRVDIANVELRFNVLGAVRNNANASLHKAKISNCGGYNPVGLTVPHPNIGVSASETVNLTGVDCTIYFRGGTVSNISVNGVIVLDGVGGVFVPAGASVSWTGSSAPTWQWFGH